jgi:hypothetical protein
MKSIKKPWWPTLTALSLALCTSVVHADERESLEALRQTTIGLIDALVEKGVLTRDVADAMLKQARQNAAATAATAAAAQAAKPETSASGKPVQRVPYVSEAMKAQIRNEVKEEVLTQARAERWGVPNASPSWADRIKIDGDFRFRYQADRPKSDNTPATAYQDSVNLITEGLMRSPEFAAQDSSLQSKASTTSDRDRERVRLRLGLTAKVSDEVGVGIRLATGNADDRVSTNQTLGNNFNKYQLFVDRAFVRVEPVEWLMINAGRIPNPWFSTDMVWSENLNFEGAAITTRLTQPDAPFEPFATVGAFPLRDEAAPTRTSRWLYGAQVGTSWLPAARTKIKAGLAYYAYHNLEGREDPDYTVSGSNYVAGVSYGQYAYTQGTLGQKGNTLFETNPVGAAAVYGLAYKFRPVVLTLSAELTHFSPYSLLATAEYVKNTAFSVSDFAARAGSSYEGVDPGGHSAGYLLRLGFGTPEVREQGQWLTSLTYKHVGSDAVVDAFTDSDMGLGGTNLQGYALAFTYGLYRNTNIGVRYLSSKSIDSPINIYNPTAKYGVSTLQVDLNVRF